MSILTYTVIAWFALIVLCAMIGLGWTVYDSIREVRLEE